jgi:peptidoglycan/LPS O-acetylase OafA/YrhL
MSASPEPIPPRPVVTHARGDFRADINGLRALSVAIVVLFHVGWNGFGGGFVGVDVFFVISGFLMTRIIGQGLARGTFSYERFLAARATRIWPALGVLVLGCLALGAALLPPSDLGQLARQALAAVPFASNQYFLDHGGYNTQGADGNWLVHTWSLSVEWQFYMLYPLVLVAGAWARRRARAAAPAPSDARPFSAWVLLAIAVPSFVAHVALSASHPEAAFFLLPTRAWEMAAGGLVWFAPRASARRGAALSYGGLALVVLSTLWLGYEHVASVGLGWRSLLPVAGAALVLASDGAANVFFDNRAAQTIGLASYSIYLWHWPVVVACWVADVMRTHPLFVGVLAIVASLLLGWLSWRLVESPWMRRRADGSRRTWRAAAALLAAAGVAALVTVATHGLGFRHGSPATLLVPAQEADYYPDRCGNFMKPAEELRVCPIVRDERRHVLVIGDSHAEHLYPWFEANSEVSVDFFTAAECPPVSNFERLQAGFHCRDYAARAWADAATPRYDTVIVSGTWNLIGGIGPPYCHADAGGPCVRVPDQEERQELARAEVRAAVRALLAAGKTVVVLDGTPEALVKVPQRLERERFWFGAPRLSIDRASLVAYAWIDVVLDELAPLPGFHRVSLRPALCDARTCEVWDAALGQPVFLDQSHFNPAWMRRHGDVFAPFVRLQRAR